jgi:hypothetical protein
VSFSHSHFPSTSVADIFGSAACKYSANASRITRYTLKDCEINDVSGAFSHSIGWPTAIIRRMQAISANIAQTLARTKTPLRQAPIQNQPHRKHQTSPLIRSRSFQLWHVFVRRFGCFVSHRTKPHSCCGRMQSAPTAERHLFKQRSLRLHQGAPLVARYRRRSISRALYNEFVREALGHRLMPGTLTHSKPTIALTAESVNRQIP